MLHNQSLFGFSLLVLSCASPTLGAVVDQAPASLDSSSPPTSPVISPSPEFTFRDINPPLPNQDHAVVTPAASTDSQSSVAHITSTSAPSATTSAMTTTLTSTLTPSLSRSFAFNQASPHHSSAHRANVHSSIASRLSTQVKLQVNTHTHTSSYTLGASTATSAASYGVHLQSASSSALRMIPTSSMSSASSSSSFSAPSSSAATSLVSPDLSTTQSLVLPTSDKLDNSDTDNSSPSDASQRARKSAILAAFLILGTLGALGGGILCFRCGLLPCCNDSQRRRRGPTMTDRTVEEGLRSLQKLSPITYHEKLGSLIPDKPPIGSQPFDFTRSLHSHTLSCSTCPPDSMNGVKGGVSGTASRSDPDWRVYATTPEGEFEDVTHILSSDAFTGKKTSDDSSSSGSRSPRDSAHSRNSGNTTSSRSEPRMSTGTVNSVRTHATSRASGGAASMTAESYTTCESRYSTPSIERDARDGPPSARASAFGSISEGQQSETEDEFHSPAPSSPNSSTSGGSVSVLLMTPEPPDYSRLADAALPRVTVIDEHGSASDATGEMDMDVEGDSDWDVATAYGAPPSPPPHSAALITRKESGSKGRGRPPTGVGLLNGPVAVGGRRCVLMHG